MPGPSGTLEEVWILLGFFLVPKRVSDVITRAELNTYLDEVKRINRRSISLKEIVKVQCRS
jgi:hypothetical protein